MASTTRTVLFSFSNVLVAAFIGGCGAPDDPHLFEDDPSLVSSGGAPPSGNVPCDMNGLWATFVEVGVEWESNTILAGAGTVRQWILTERTGAGTPQGLELSRVCGIGAFGVPLGSPWFSTISVPEIQLKSEWTGVQFLPQLFDNGALPVYEVQSQSNSVNPGVYAPGDVYRLAAVPFSFGLEGLGEQPWPEIGGMQPFVIDHDRDSYPGIAGVPFQGHVPGEPDGVDFLPPRLSLEVEPRRAARLFLTLRTRGALEGQVVSCDPTRIEGIVVPSTLLIESRNVGCLVVGAADCAPEEVQFIDSNLPKFAPNGTSTMVTLSVPHGTTCSDVRAMSFD
jgi:hypothetical protein